MSEEIDCWRKEYYRCPDWPSYPYDTAGEDRQAVSHDISHKHTIDLVFDKLYSIDTKRLFSLGGDHSYSKSSIHVTSVDCAGANTPPCLGWCYQRSDTYSASCSESCEIKKDTIYYIDMSKQILFYKHEEEKLEFRTKSGGDTTPMKGKFGTSTHHKLKIKDAKIKGVERFILVFNGEKRIIEEQEYEREPSWEMGPIGIPNANSGVTMPTNCDEYDHAIQQIIAWPNPQSKAIPMENEVRCLGFYDYGSDEPGKEPRLLRPDGGKDFFYPSWCRGMLSDPWWRSAADARVGMTWDHLPPSGIQDFNPGLPLYEVYPKGNAFSHTRIGNMFSFVYRNRDGVQKVIAELNGQDPKNAIIALGVTGYGNDWAYHPVSVL